MMVDLSPPPSASVRDAADADTFADTSPDVSLVVPLYNEEGNVDLLHEAVTAVLGNGARSYELLLVDDGSSDGTLAAAIALVDRDPRVRVVEFRRNYGQTAAMAAGIHSARGRVIVTMDGDLQNDPRDIPLLLEKIDQGMDLVAGWRRKRQDEGKRVFISKIANRIINGVLGVEVRDSGCSLKAYRRELIQALPLHGEMHRFIPALSQLAGARMAQIEVRHHPRRFGVSKYGFSRIYKVALDIVSIHFLLKYARRPLTWLVNPMIFGVACAIALLVLAEFFAVFPLVIWGAAFMVISLVGLLGFWTLAGFFLAVEEPRVAEFSAISAHLLSPSQLQDVAP
jgi:glycosyltransferase involved in cell wall biosynthesis